MPAGFQWRRIAMIVLSFAIACCILPAAAHARTPLKTCVMRDTGSQDPAALFAAPDRFDCTTPQRAFGPGSYWLLSQPLPAGASGELLRQGSVWQDRVTLYVRYTDGAIRHVAFTSRTTWRLLQLGAVIQIPLPAHSAAPERLLWHVEGSLNRRGILVAPVLVDRHTAQNSDREMVALYAAFAGMCLALLIYNLAIWAALRQGFQPAYCVMVLCLLAYALSASGLLGQLTGMDNNDRQRLSYMLLALIAASAVIFVRAFMERRVFDGWLRPASNVVIGFLLLSAASFTVFVPRYAGVTDLMCTIGYCMVVALTVPVVWRAWRLRSRFLLLFALAWGPPVLCAVVRILASMSLVKWQLWIDNSTFIALALEASMSSVGIAYRIRLLSRERDEARAQEVAALRLAAVDPLTGLLNRRAFLEAAMARAGEHQLVLIDIDHFKAVNETIGHDGGDEVLRVFARALRSVAAPESLIARIGGEEFAILTPAAAPLDARLVLDGLRGHRMPFDLGVTASIGTCVGPLDREIDWKTMYRNADRALFEAKAAGRDRVRHGLRSDAA